MLYIVILLFITVFGWFGFVMAVDAFEALWIGDFKNAIWPGIGFSAVVGCFMISLKN